MGAAFGEASVWVTVDSETNAVVAEGVVPGEDIVVAVTGAFVDGEAETFLTGWSAIFEDVVATVERDEAGTNVGRIRVIVHSCSTNLKRLEFVQSGIVIILSLVSNAFTNILREIRWDEWMNGDLSGVSGLLGSGVRLCVSIELFDECNDVWVDSSSWARWSVASREVGNAEGKAGVAEDREVKDIQLDSSINEPNGGADDDVESQRVGNGVCVAECKSVESRVDVLGFANGLDVAGVTLFETQDALVD